MNTRKGPADGCPSVCFRGVEAAIAAPHLHAFLQRMEALGSVFTRLAAVELEVETRPAGWGTSVFTAHARLLLHRGPSIAAHAERHQPQRAVEAVFDELGAALLAATQLGHLPFAVAATGMVPSGHGVG